MALRINDKRLARLEAVRHGAGLFFMAWDNAEAPPVGPGALVVRAPWPGPGAAPASRWVEPRGLSLAEFDALTLEVERRGLPFRAERTSDAARARLAMLSDEALVALAFRDAVA
ncbi:hypothetical protein [Salinarimonas soli]|uniref:Uncharacterized protein n=1 Tax=Salinarimonas soli TaxID=1638099 RepID=A0A5B2VR50_9HYPH|nr:hypothetical protein [Salinarimonas soli]KAA2241148.1 hypothetical protein F0L46_04950 [Salinarimonas soli]